MRFNNRDRGTMRKSSNAIIALAFILSVLFLSGLVSAGNWYNYDNFDCCSFRTDYWWVAGWYGNNQPSSTPLNTNYWTDKKYYCENNWGFVKAAATLGGKGILVLQKDKDNACAKDLRVNAYAIKNFAFTKLRIKDKWHYETKCNPRCGHGSEVGLYINSVAYGFVFDDGWMWAMTPNWVSCSGIHSDDEYYFYFTWDGTTLRGWAQNLIHPSESCGSEASPITLGTPAQPRTNNFYMATQLGGGYAQRTVRYQSADVMEYYMISSPRVSVTSPGNVEVSNPNQGVNLRVVVNVNSEAQSVRCDRYVDGTKRNSAPITVNTAGGIATVDYTDTYAVGSHTFRFDCTDFMGQTGTNTAYFSVLFVDRVAPTISLRSYPTSAKALPITAKILVTDDQTQSLSCRFSESTGRINPGTFTCTSGTECSFNVGTGATPPGGTYTITITCQDAASNSASTSFSFKFDSSAPTIVLNEPSNGITLNVNSINFSFTPTDNDPMNCTLDISVPPRVNINNVPSGVKQTKSRTPPLTSGTTYSWSVNCTDIAGNMGKSETRTFTYVMSPDTISLVSPDNGYRTSSSSQIFTFTHDFTRKLWFITLLPTCGLNINGVQVATMKDVPAGTQKTFSYDGLVEGTTSWYVNCSIYLWPLVSAAARSAETRSLIIDMSAPAVSLVSPDDNNVVSLPYPTTTQNVQFRFTVSDTQASSFTCSLWTGTSSNALSIVETKSVSAGTNTFTRTLGAGTYYWKVNCDDGFYTAFAPASGSRKLTIKIIDVTAPIITLVYPSNNAVINTDFAFKFKVTDDMSTGSGAIGCNLILNGRMDNGGYYTSGNDVWTINPSKISGVTTWKIRCTDSTGNSRDSEERIVTVDRPPTISYFTPVTETYLNKTLVTFKFVVIDDIDPTLTCNITIDGVVQPSITAINSQEMQVSYTLAPGKHTSKLQCRDSRNGVTDDPVVYVDINPPLLTASKPANNLTTCNMRTSFTFSVSDDLAKTVACKIMLGTNWIYGETITLPSTAGTPVERTFIPSQDLPLGKNEWYVQCTDQAGNANTSAKRNLTITNTDPDNFRITFVPPTLSTGWYTINDNLVVNVTATKDLSTAWLDLNGTTYFMNGANKNWYISKSGMESGPNIYRVYGRGADTGCLAYAERTIVYRPEYAIPENRPFILTLAEFQEPAIWTAVVLAIAALFIAIAYMLSKLFSLPEWEAFAKNEFGQLIFSAFLFVMFVLISGIIEEGTNSLASDILVKTAATGEQVTYWTYNSQAGSWSTTNNYRCNYPCHIYLARGFLGITYESYKNSFKEVSDAYVVSKLYESLAVGNTMEFVPATVKFDISFSVPMFAGRAIYDNSLETAIKDLSKAMMMIKAQEVALAYSVNLAFAFFIGGLVLRILWFTRKFGGLLIALAIGIYVFLPFIYILGWYTVDKTGIMFDFQDPAMVGGAGEIGDTFLGETDISSLFSAYDTEGRETKMGLLDVAGRAYIAAIFIPALAILTVIGFVRHFSPMIGGDNELAGLSKLI